jgi:hypothetical protein
MIIRNTDTTRAAADLASTTSYSIDLEKASSANVQVIFSDSAPAAITFDGSSAAVVSAANDTITYTAHGYVTGTKVAASTAGTLPTGLSATNYWVVKVDANTLKLASSLANAEAGTVVNITAVGVGNSTLTPATSAGNVCKLQEGNDDTNWEDVSGASETIATTAGNASWNYTGSSRYLRVLYTPSAGQVNLAIKTCLIKTERF